MRLTYWNPDEKNYEVRIYENDGLILRTDGEVSGLMVDRLAEYENIGLTPDEIKELGSSTLKNLKESNRILRKNNDEYYVACQKLLDENHKLKSLLKSWLDSDT